MAVPAPRSSSRRFVTAGLLLGVGLGGFVDGIVLHQILQWHHMLTSTNTDNLGLRDYPASSVAGLEVNTLWDGLFHATTWMFVAVGLALLWRAWQQRQAPRGRPQPGRTAAGRLGAVQPGRGYRRPPPARHPPRQARQLSAAVRPRLPRPWRGAAGRRLGAVPLWADRAGPGHLGPAGDTPTVVAG